ncbi:FtsX-like permease family protein [bacterium]|nr:FtsX-like permease family protein [bacterium]
MSLALISLMSVFVISLVVWLLILFLSVTEGIEKNWLGRLTSLNAPLRVTPTEEYYQSYYHLVDEHSYASNYEKKTFHEKLVSKITDPYDENIDSELPLYIPQATKGSKGEVLDLAKEVEYSLAGIPKEIASISSHDYQMAGALLKLTMARASIDRPNSSIPTLNVLTQAAYVNSIPTQKGPLHSLLVKPTAEDINHLIYLARIDRGERESQQQVAFSHKGNTLADRLLPIFNNIHIKKFATLNRFSLPSEVVQEPLIAFAKMGRGEIFYFKVPAKVEEQSLDQELTKGVLKREDGKLVFLPNGKETALDAAAPIFLDGTVEFTGEVDHLSLLDATLLTDLLISAKIGLQGHTYSTVVPWHEITIADALIENEYSAPPEIAPPWAYFIKDHLVLKDDGVLLPIHYKEQGCLIGDDGTFSFGKTSPLMVSEQTKNIITSGFYDPGVISTGARFILTSRDVVSAITSKEENLVIDPLIANGFQVWFDDTMKAGEVAAYLKEDFAKRGISSYFAITPFYEYDFAKDLIGQFQSDRDLFMLIGVIILLVAVCNIITLLLLLVHDKKTEIGIFLSLGASKFRISSIFALAGIILGGLSTLIGSALAYFTLKNINSLVSILNMIEGRDAFNAAFYGSSLPNEFSMLAFSFILIAAPLLSLGAGLIPAIKACKLRPSQILRSE